MNDDFLSKLDSEDSSAPNKSTSVGATTILATEKSLGRNPQFLFVFDFDHTIVDVNSDLFIQGAFNIKPVPEHFKIIAKERGWTSYMQEVFRFHYTNDVSKKQYGEALETLPFVPGLPECIRKLVRMGAELIVISDANTFFIRHILEHHGLDGYFHEVISNPAHFDGSGQLIINPYHANLECKLSSRNLCKGRALMEYVRQRHEEGTAFKFIGFAGDGVNDFCPMARLHSGDVACPRQDFSICDFIERKKEQDGVILRARLLYWTGGADIVNGVRRKLEEMGLAK